MNFREFKEKHSDSIALFKFGNVYECYESDAVVVSSVYHTELQHIEKNGQTLTMTNFVTKALELVLPKLIRAGHRVCIVDMPDPAFEKPFVKRNANLKYQ